MRLDPGSTSSLPVLRRYASRLASCAIATALLVLGGCASTPREGHQNGQVSRLSPEALARMTPPAKPTVPLSEVIMWSGEGVKPEAIVKRLRETGTFYNLTPQQIVDLNKQGVDQRVINHLVDAQEKARQATLLTQLADRDAQAAQELERERNRRRALQQHYGTWQFGYGAQFGGPYNRWGPSLGFGWRQGGFYDPFYRGWPRW